MNTLLLLIPISLLLLGVAIWAFFWATGSGQYDDLDSPAWRILHDDDRHPPQPRNPGRDRRDATENDRQ